jgi:hypothetical protein
MINLETESNISLVGRLMLLCYQRAEKVVNKEKVNVEMQDEISIIENEILRRMKSP